MPKLRRYTAKNIERILLSKGYSILRQKGSHRIYAKKSGRIVLPFHSGQMLHPKIVKQVFSSIGLNAA